MNHANLIGRTNENGDIVVLDRESGEAATRIDANVYPVSSDLSARYEHADGIVLTRDDADLIGLTVE